MFIVWGTKIKRKRLGRVADFCAICRGPRPFELTRIGAAGHLYGISFGQGKLVGYEAACEVCRTPMDADPKDYVAVATSEIPEFRVLAEKTNPALRDIAEARSREDAAVRQAAPGSEERERLIFEPFAVVHGMVEKQAVESRMSPRGRRACWGVFGLALLATVFLGASGSDSSETIRQAALASMVGSWLLGVTVWVVFRSTSMGWFMAQEAEPRLARSLAPLEPSLEEIDSMRQHLRDMGMRIGKKLKAQRLFDSIQALRTQPRELPSRPAPIA